MRLSKIIIINAIVSCVSFSALSQSDLYKRWRNIRDKCADPDHVEMATKISNSIKKGINASKTIELLGVPDQVTQEADTVVYDWFFNSFFCDSVNNEIIRTPDILSVRLVKNSLVYSEVITAVDNNGFNRMKNVLKKQ